MRFVLALFLFAHGFAHLPGLAGAWRLGTGVPHKTTLLGGRLDLGEGGIRAFGVVWLLGALAFIAAAAALALGQPLWTTLALAAAVFSLAISVLALPDAVVGVWVNVALLALLLAGARLGWL
ncbi:MAG TPA: ABC transporter permease [Vicinamibacteria bacterium]|jgi:hypothetical protein